MTQKLDTFSKIILATGSINYLASMVEGVNSEMKMTPGFMSEGSVHKEGVDKRDKDMDEALALLEQVMGKLGNSLEEQCAIDIYVTTPAFNVLIHGHDDVEGDFENIE